MARPLIGLTTYMDTATYGANQRYAAVLPMAYVRAVHRSGGRAGLIPPGHPRPDVLDPPDRPIFPRGADVGPAPLRRGAPPGTPTTPGPADPGCLLPGA